MGSRLFEDEKHRYRGDIEHQQKQSSFSIVGGGENKHAITKITRSKDFPNLYRSGAFLASYTGDRLPGWRLWDIVLILLSLATGYRMVSLRGTDENRENSYSSFA